jgi:hypothetical protein
MTKICSWVTANSVFGTSEWSFVAPSLDVDLLQRRADDEGILSCDGIPAVQAAADRRRFMTRQKVATASGLPSK